MAIVGDVVVMVYAAGARRDSDRGRCGIGIRTALRSMRERRTSSNSKCCTNKHNAPVDFRSDRLLRVFQPGHFHG
jgi:hypothetical protein